MGGTIGFTIREKNDQEHRLFLWTNLFPYFLNNVKFIEEDEEHLKEHLQDFHDRAENSNAGLYPVQYGLIVVDYPSHTILHSQSYSHVGAIEPAGVALAIMDNGEKMHPLHVLDGTEFKRYEALFSSGRVKKVANFVTGVGFEEVDAAGLTMEEFAESAGMRLDSRHEYAILDMSPWKVTEFYGSVAEQEKMRDAVRALGFVLTEQEETAWQEWIDEKRRYEHE